MRQWRRLVERDLLGITELVVVLACSGRMAATNLLTVYFGAPSMFITLWFGFDYGTNPPLGTLII
jgi:hypothetical protein